MLHVLKSRWRNCWHIYEIDIGGKVWLATFRSEVDAYNWVRRHYAEECDNCGDPISNGETFCGMCREMGCSEASSLTLQAER
jgi:hypothetical protein